MEENAWKHELSYSAFPRGAASATEIEMVCVMNGESMVKESVRNLMERLLVGSYVNKARHKNTYLCTV